MDFDISKMQEMLSRAGEMQERIQAKLAVSEVEAQSGGGMVTVRMSGKKEVLRIRIQPTAIGSTAADLELLEDLITAAVNEAGRRADDLMQSAAAGMMGGLGLPGIG